MKKKKLTYADAQKSRELMKQFMKQLAEEDAELDASDGGFCTAHREAGSRAEFERFIAEKR